MRLAEATCIVGGNTSLEGTSVVAGTAEETRPIVGRAKRSGGAVAGSPEGITGSWEGKAGGLEGLAGGLIGGGGVVILFFLDGVGQDVPSIVQSRRLNRRCGFHIGVLGHVRCVGRGLKLVLIPCVAGGRIGYSVRSHMCKDWVLEDALLEDFIKDTYGDES